MDKIESIARENITILVGDFNCNPSSNAWKKFEKFGLRNVFGHDGQEPQATHHIMGHPVACIDAIFVSSHIVATDSMIISQKEQNGFPSDHFGLFSKLQLKNKGAAGSN